MPTVFTDSGKKYTGMLQATPVPLSSHSSLSDHTICRYLVYQIMVPAGQEEGAKALVMAMSPGARLTYSLGGTLKYELPTSEVSLSKVFNTMAQAKASGMTVLDW